MTDKDEILQSIQDYFEKNSEERNKFWETRTVELKTVIDELKCVKEDHQKLIDAVGDIDTFKTNIKELNNFLVGAKSIIFIGKIVGGISIFCFAVWNFFFKKGTA
jgi:hypothetical protein